MIMKRQIGEKGQIVIPKDVRKMFKINSGTTLTIEVEGDSIILKKEQDPEEFLKDFLDVPKPKKNLTLKDLKKIEYESYGIH